MRKFLFFIIFTIISFGFSTEIKAQSNISSQKSDDGVLVAYPNPTKDVLFLKTKNFSSKIKTVTFFSILGAQVAEYNVNSNSTELRLDKLQPGKYLMRYTLDDNTQKITQIVKR